MPGTHELRSTYCLVKQCFTEYNNIYAQNIKNIHVHNRYNLCLGAASVSQWEAAPDTRHNTVVSELKILSIIYTLWIEVKMFGSLDTRISPEMHFMGAMRPRRLRVPSCPLVGPVV